MRPTLVNDSDSSAISSSSTSTEKKSTSSPRTIKARLKVLQQKADEGDIDAICSLGACYMIGEGVEADKEKAFQYYTLAAKEENPTALYQVGFCYMYGKGTQMDKRKGFDSLMKSAELGNPRAQFAIGHFYEYGNEWIEIDYATASKWYTEAASQGHKGAAKALDNLQ